MPSSSKGGATYEAIFLIFSSPLPIQMEFGSQVSIYLSFSLSPKP